MSAFCSWHVCRRRTGGIASRAAWIPILAFGSVVGLTPALAQTPPQTRTVEVVVSRTVPAASCAAEGVMLNGTLHLVMQTTTIPNGAKQTSVVAELNEIQASGRTSQAAYRLDNQRKERQDFGCGPGEHCLRDIVSPFRVTGPGPDDGTGGTLLARLAVDPRGHVTGTLVDARFACRQ
jgi:hypothetical protein